MPATSRARQQRSGSRQALVRRRLPVPHAPRDVRDGRRRARRRRLDVPVPAEDPLALSRMTKQEDARAVRAVARRSLMMTRISTSLRRSRLLRVLAGGLRGRRRCRRRKPRRSTAGASLWVEPTRSRRPRSVLRPVGRGPRAGSDGRLQTGRAQARRRQSRLDGEGRTRAGSGASSSPSRRTRSRRPGRSRVVAAVLRRSATTSRRSITCRPSS